MSYYNNANPYNLDLDANGQPLNTARNFQILEDIERQRAAPPMAPMYPEARYDGGHYPSQNGYARDTYYPEQHYGSRESARHVYNEGRGTTPTGGSFYREREPSYDNGRFSNPLGGSAVPNRLQEENDQAAPTGYFNYSDSRGSSSKKEIDKPAAKRSDREVRISIPHNGIYHWTLLPKGLREDRIVTASRALSEFYKTIDGEKVKMTNVGDYYASSIIKTEEDAVNRAEDMFSENLFKEHLDNKEELSELEIIEIHNETGKNMVRSFGNSYLVDKLLKEISRTPNFDKNKIYTFDYVNSTRYFSNKTQNLFLDVANSATSFKDIVEALPLVFSKYSENEMNINSLLTIDAELTRDFLIFIRGFTGNENIKLKSFMNSVGRLYAAADSYVDMTAQKNIKTGIERFTNILFLNMRKLNEEIGNVEGIYVPRKELSIVTRAKNIREELSSLEEKNESRFYLVDEGYTPELARLISKVDSLKIISGYTKTTLYTIDGLYQIVKTKGKGYYIALIDIYKI